MAENGEQLYGEFADLSALEEQKRKVIAIFTEVKAGIKSLSEAGIRIDGAQSIRDLSGAEKEYNAYIKQTELLVKQLADSEAKLVLLRQKETLQLTENKQRLKELNKEQSERLRIQNAEKGSIEELSLKYDKAYRIFKQLSEAQRQTDRGQALGKFLSDTNTKLKELEGGLGNFRRNVGNYAGSLAKPFETLIKKVEELKKGLAKGEGIGGKKDAQSIKDSQYAITIITDAITKSNTAGTTTVKQVKNLANAYRDLSTTLGNADGQTLTFLQELKEQVGDAKDNVDDLNQELKLAASDTKGIDNVVGSLNALAGIAQGAAGAYALMGASQEDAAVITSKLIAVQGIANSIQTVGTELTRKGTIANKAYTYIQGLMTIATNATATASARLNAVLKLSTIGIVVAAIGGLIYLISKASSATSDFAKKQEHLSSVMNDTKDAYVKANLEVNNLKIAFEQAKGGIITKGEALKLYNETIGKTTGQVKTLDEAEKELAKNADAYIQFTLLKAAANVALQKAAEKAFEAQFKRKNPDDADLSDQAGNAITKNPLGTFLGLATVKTVIPNASQFEANRRDAKKKNDILVADLESDNKTLLDIAKDFQKQAEELGKKFKFDFNGISEPKDGAANKPAKIKDNTAADILKEQFEQKKILLQRGIDADRKVFEDESRIFSERLDALKTFTAAQMNLVNLETNFEIETEKLRLAEIKAGLEEQKKEKGANIKAINEQIANETEASNVKIETIVLKGNDNLIKIGEDFNKDLKTLKDARQALRKEEEKDLEDYEEFTMGWLKEFRKKQYQANVDWDKADLDREKKQKADLISIGFRAGQEMQDTFLFFLTASIDKETSLLETRQRLLDEDTERRINQINMLGLTEQERVKRTAEVEKQAMFETEQIERRKRKLAVERAKFEKLANIASIISSTAQAVVAALGSKPWTPFNIAMATIVGGLGVLQLARAVAAPLPQYYTGTDSAEPGLAWTGEKGRELMKKDGRYYLTPGTPTLMQMAGGEQITPADVTQDILNSIDFIKSTKNGMTVLQPVGMSSSQADTMINEIKDLKKETSRSKISMTMISDHGWNIYITKNIRN